MAGRIRNQPAPTPRQGRARALVHNQAANTTMATATKGATTAATANVGGPACVNVARSRCSVASDPSIEVGAIAMPTTWGSHEPANAKGRAITQGNRRRMAHPRMPLYERENAVTRADQST